MSAGTVILAIAALYWTRALIIPIVLAVLLTLILGPMVNWLQRRGVGRVLAVLLVVSLACLILGTILAVVLLQTKRLALMLPEYKTVIAQKLVDLRDIAPGSWLDEVGDAVQEIRTKIKEVEPTVKEGSASEPIPVTLAPSPWSLFLSAGSAVDVFISAGLVVVLVIFMLIRREDLRTRLIRLFGDGNLIRMTRALDDAAACISRYLLMQFLVNASYGFVLGAGLFVLGVPYSALWGFLAAVLRYVPYLGAWIGAAFPIAISAAVMPNWTAPLLVIAFIVILELVVSNFVEPVVFGRSLGISEVALLISAAFWTWLWGPMGLVLATPLTACLVVLGRFVPAMSSLTILLGDEAASDADIGFYQRLLARDQDEAIAFVEEQLQSRPVHEVLDQIVLATLVRTKQNLAQGELSEADALFVYHVVGELLDELESGQASEGSWSVGDVDPQERSVFGWTANSSADQLGLRCLSYLLKADGVHLDCLPSETTAEELATLVTKEKPASLCLATIPPEALTPLCRLCKRLRLSGKDLGIVIAGWGRKEKLSVVAEKLVAAGADSVGTTLSESREQLLGSLPKIASAPEQSVHEATELSV